VRMFHVKHLCAKKRPAEPGAFGMSAVVLAEKPPAGLQATRAYEPRDLRTYETCSLQAYGRAACGRVACGRTGA